MLGVFVAGFFLGVVAGAFLAGLLHASHDSDSENEDN